MSEEAWRELLKYPNPEGLHPVEAAWRDHARSLLNELNETKAELAVVKAELSVSRSGFLR